MAKNSFVKQGGVAKLICTYASGRGPKMYGVQEGEGGMNMTFSARKIGMVPYRFS